MKKEIDMLTLQVDGTESSLEVLSKLEQKQKEYDNLINERSDISYYRKKAKWMEKGEKCNKLFFDLQQRIVSKKNIQKLIKSDSITLTTPIEILN